MNLFQKIKTFSRSSRIIIGILAIAIGYFQSDGTFNWSWWYLGILPLIAGLINFCPLCSLANKCDIRSKK
jgi:hypothetical protein